MKAKLKHLRKGDLVTASVVELVGEGALICSFDGDLLRVKNTSGRQINKHEKITLVVAGLDPLEFRLNSFTRSKLDRFI